MTTTCLSPAAAVTLVGAPGVVVVDNGFRAVLDADAGPVPALFVAVTVKVYDVDEFKFEIVHEVVLAEQVPPLLEAVTV